MNEYDSSKMADILMDSHDLELTQDEAQADVLLLNTCSVREKAQEKVFSQLGRWRKLKAKQPELVIGVGGCVASQEGRAILKRASYVDLIFGPQTLHRLPQLFDQAIKQKKSQIDISFPEIEKFDHMPEARVDGVTAYVSIMEGCSKYCTFCVVPYTRGEEFSRPFDDVVAEIAGLAARGVKEVTLLGQNVNAYQGETHDGDTADLALLMHYVAAIEGIERIRYSTSHPLEMSDSLIQSYAEIPKLVSHLHLPIQTGSNALLQAMKRRHTTDEYRDIVHRIREIRPNISLSSDFIVGYPGETERDFKDTMDFIAEINFDHSYSFVYSQRPGTPAADIDDDVPLELKKQRLALLQQRLSQQSADISRKMVGSTQRILVTGLSPKQKKQLDLSAYAGDKSVAVDFDATVSTKNSQLTGRTENNRVVNFTGNHDLIGTFINVNITAAFANSLQGELPLSDSVSNGSHQ
ncbi:tRNA-i(6)A37 methylthiotransferase [hydrothermal vent metagenome]|uniref:tRNA-i(6)A37 methylthiotransferase n=1 Tax=hydrothermal vent metagenome TaxID=652676 RepID=A0A3B1AA90_9ZZZZ